VPARPRQERQGQDLEQAGEDEGRRVAPRVGRAAERRLQHDPAAGADE
jgi:hypothetical protein